MVLLTDRWELSAIRIACLSSGGAGLGGCLRVVDRWSRHTRKDIALGRAWMLLQLMNGSIVERRPWRAEFLSSSNGGGLQDMAQGP